MLHEYGSKSLYLVFINILRNLSSESMHGLEQFKIKYFANLPKKKVVMDLWYDLP